MDLEKEKKLKEIYQKIEKSISSDTSKSSLDVINDPNSYIDGRVVTEKNYFNRYQKIKALEELSANIDDFISLFKNDPILNKIVLEFQTGRFYFDDKIKKEISSYPEKKQVLYYFDKHSKEINISCDYDKLKKSILSKIPNIDNSQDINLSSKVLNIRDKLQSNKKNEFCKPKLS